MDASLDATGLGHQGNFMETKIKAGPYPAEWAHLARVTDVVRFAYPDAFAGIPERSRDFYFARGSGNHKLWEDVENGVDGNFEYDPECEKYRAGHAKWKRETGFRALPGGVELQVYSEELGVKGTIDLLGTVGQRIWLPDLKTSKAEPKPTALQTAIYTLLLPGYKFTDIERYGVGVKNNGTYSMTPRFPDTDENEARYWIKKFKEAHI